VISGRLEELNSWRKRVNTSYDACLKYFLILFIFKLFAGQQPSQLCKLDNDAVRKGVLSYQAGEKGWSREYVS